MTGPLVLKFGGTSVDDRDALERLAEIVRSRLAAQPVVVVSAMRGVTDALLEGTALALAEGQHGARAQNQGNVWS